MVTQSDILEDILNHIKDSGIVGSKKTDFGVLRTTSDSVCILNEANTESKAGVTPYWVRGTLKLKVVYRVMQPKEDIEAMKTMDSILNLLVSTYKEININNANKSYFIDGVKILETSKLETVYSGGTKDYAGVLTIVYERKTG